MRKFNPLPLGVLKGNGRSVCTDIMFKDMAKGNYELTRRGKKKPEPTECTMPGWADDTALAYITHAYYLC